MSKKKSGILRNLRNPGIFRTGYIQNPGIFRTRGIFTTLPYSEPWDIKNPRQIQNPVKHLRWSVVQKLLTAIVVFANYNYFCNISFVRSLLFKI